GQTVPVPKFEVASIRPCTENLAPGMRSGGGGPLSTSPGHLSVNCQTVKGLIQAAYVIFATGSRRSLDTLQSTTIEGGPDWITTERYTIEAKAEGEPTSVVMHGPMLQALLEDRFKLRIRHETRDVPVYA